MHLGSSFLVKFHASFIDSFDRTEESSRNYNSDQSLTKAKLYLVELTTKAAPGPRDTTVAAIITDQSTEASSDITSSCTMQFDESWRYSRRIAGGGAILFDNSRRITCALAKNFTWGNRAKEIEALALKMGIDLAIDKKHQALNNRRRRGGFTKPDQRTQ